MSGREEELVPAHWLLRTLDARGVDRAFLCERAQLDEDQLTDPEVALEVMTFLRLFEASAERLGDPCLGLHFAEIVETRDFGLLGYLAENAPTLRDVCSIISHYHTVFTDVFGLRFYQEAGKAHFDYREVRLPEGPAQQDIDFTLAVLVVQMRRRIGEDWRPDRCSFTFAPPQDLREHHRIFGRDLRFHAPRSGLSFDAEILREEVPEADAGLFSVLRKQADELIARTRAERPSNLADQVRWRISSGLGVRIPGAEEVAEGLHLSVRQLHRRLSGEGTSFRELRKETLHSAACEALAFTQERVTDIALRLGYSETSAFTRAFTRQQGVSPLDYRKDLRKGDAEAQGSAAAG
ncbi:MAG: AraC family transcriptional regulator [Myxococcota bacterium]